MFFDPDLEQGGNANVVVRRDPRQQMDVEAVLGDFDADEHRHHGEVLTDHLSS